MRKFPLRRLLSASSALLSLFATLSASAAPLELAALPSGKASKSPEREEAPGWIPGNQVLAGLERVAANRTYQREAGYQEWVFFDDPARASAFKVELKEGTGRTVVATSDTCFATVTPFRLPPEHDGRPLEWDTFSADRFVAQHFRDDMLRKVLPVRAERLLEADGKVTLRTLEFWLDLRSGGTRLISRSEQPLARVATPFAGVNVFAMRTGDESVAFFVRRDTPLNPASDQGEVLALIDTLPVSRSSADAFDISQIRTTVANEAHLSPCAFERVDLALNHERESEAGGSGTPGLPLKGRRLRKGVFVERVGPAEMANVAFATVLSVEKEPKPSEETPPAAFFTRSGTAQIRNMVVNLGIARGGPEQAAVPTVSYRWLERRRPMTF